MKLGEQNLREVARKAGKGLSWKERLQLHKNAEAPPARPSPAPALRRTGASALCRRRR